MSLDVARMLLGSDDVEPVSEPDPTCGHSQPDPARRLDRRTGGEWWERNKPADWRWRTTPEDVLADAVAMAEEKLPLGTAAEVAAVVYGGHTEASAREQRMILETVAACRRQVMRELAKDPSRPARVKLNWKPRTEAPCSSVVTRSKYNPDAYLVDGVPVDEIPADALTPPPYAPVASRGVSDR